MRKYIFSIPLLTFGLFFFGVSYAHAATLYYNAAVDTDWNTLGNWWTDDTFKTPASSLPTTTDDVTIEGNLSANTGPLASIKTITINGSSSFQNVTVTVSELATFNDSVINNYGTVNGNAIFNASSLNRGTINGNATFNDLSYNMGTVSGDAMFNYASDGTITLANNQTWGTVTGSVKGSDDILLAEFVFNDTSGNIAVLGDGIFGVLSRAAWNK